MQLNLSLQVCIGNKSSIHSLSKQKLRHNNTVWPIRKVFSPLLFRW